GYEETSRGAGEQGSRGAGEHGGPVGIPNTPTLGFLARMCADKGLETLIEAYVLLRRRDRVPRLRLRVAGSSTNADLPFVTRLIDRLADAGLDGEVEFLPNLDRDEKIAFL